MPTDAFDDDGDLTVPQGVVSDRDLTLFMGNLLRADLSGERRGVVLATIRNANEKDRKGLLLCLVDALRDDGLVRFIEESASRRTAAIELAKALAPPDPAASHNAIANASVRAFTHWENFPYGLIIVPGYTPMDQKQPLSKVHPVAARRLEMAKGDLDQGKAPFVLVSGANVYPRETPYFEAILMRDALCASGAAGAHIVVDARARHTTTNLRNAGRFMRAHGIEKGLIVTKGGGVGGSDFFGQDFYLANPEISTFHSRCRKELGYEVGSLRSIGEGRIEFRPSPSVDRLSYRDPLDP